MAEYRLPPRQKMINLVYVILIAMLAINISADTLDTYSLLNRGLRQRAGSLGQYGDRLRDSLVSTVPHLTRAVHVIDSMTADLITDIESAKEETAKAADGKKYVSADELRSLEDLNAVPDVMLSAIRPRGAMLKAEVEAFRDTLLAEASDSITEALLLSCLSLEADKKLTSWEKGVFTSMPAIGGMVYMNTLRENVLIARAITYQHLLGTRTESGEEEQADARYVLINHDQKIVDADGTIEVPVVSITPHIESVLYGEFDNPVDVLAVGISPEEIDYEVSGARHFLRDGMLYVCPLSSSGTVRVGMHCERKGKTVDLGSRTFRVRQLPVPSPLVRFSDGTSYAGTVPVEKSRLLKMSGISAGISEPVKIVYEVTGFETVLVSKGGEKVLSAVSGSSELTAEQKRIIEGAENGDKLYFTGISAKSPNGATVYRLAPISAPVYE